MISWKFKGRYSVIDGVRFIVAQQPEDVAIQQLVAHGLTEDAVRELLANPATKSTWHTAFAQAAAATTLALAATIEHAAEAADVEEIREQQTALVGAVDQLRSELSADRVNQERRELEQRLDAEADRIRAALVASKLNQYPAMNDRIIWERLWKTPAGVRLQELRSED